MAAKIANLLRKQPRDWSSHLMDRRRFVTALSGIAVGWKLANLMEAEASAKGSVVVAAGRRVDAPDAQTARFPPSNVDAVRQKIGAFFAHEKPSALVSSGACGADLLALQVAGERHMKRYMVLGADVAEFRKSSVTDRPGNWGNLFDQAIKASKVEVLKVPDGQEGYLETNLKLLDRAQAVAKQAETTVVALVIWNEQSRGSDDVTDHFLQQAKQRNIPVTQISTL
jgi:hypothetical protein